MVIGEKNMKQETAVKYSKVIGRLFRKQDPRTLPGHCRQCGTKLHRNNSSNIWFCRTCWNTKGSFEGSKEPTNLMVGRGEV